LIDNVSVTDGAVAVPEPGETLARFNPEGLDDLDRVYLFADMAEDGRLVSRARADLERAATRARVDQVGHDRDDVGLRDRLAVPDRQRPVFIGEPAIIALYEFVARDRRERAHYALIERAPVQVGRCVADVLFDFAQQRHALGLVWIGRPGNRGCRRQQEQRRKPPPRGRADLIHPPSVRRGRRSAIRRTLYRALSK